MNWRGGMRMALSLIMVASCLFGWAISKRWALFLVFQTALLSVDWMLPVCLTTWCGTFIFLTFRLNDLPLIGLLLIVIITGFISHTSQPTLEATVFLAGIMLGKSTLFLFQSRKRKAETEDVVKFVACDMSLVNYLIGLVGLLVFSSWRHLDGVLNFYPGTRWIGLWHNPNIYGMLMGAGVVLAAGLLAGGSWKMGDGEEEKQNPRLLNCGEKGPQSGNAFVRLLSFFPAKTNWFLGIAVFMMGVGLVMSYSRGAWLATSIALLYLTWCYGQVKWRFVLPVVLVTAAVVALFWHSTAVTDPWYLKRLDFSRPSAQHRVSAWRGAVQMLRDHPLGVGWNQAVSVYDKNYSAPEDGAAALAMNSYFMLGTELGLPGLLAFMAYVGLCFRKRPHQRPALAAKAVPSSVLRTPSPLLEEKDGLIGNTPEGAAIPRQQKSLHMACRAGALVFVVAFWFDGGLFDLPTAALFWVLLELGTSDLKVDKNCRESFERNA